MKKFLQISTITFLLVLVLVPGITFAQTFAQPLTGVINAVDPSTGCLRSGDFGYIFCKLAALLNSLIPLLVALGVVYFVWGVVQYVIGGSEESKGDGRTRMIWGIIGLSVIVGLYGLVNIVVNTFDLRANSLQFNMPTLVSNSGSQSGGACSDLIANRPKFQDVLSYGTCLIGAAVIPFIFALATLMFIWGAVQFLIIGAGDEQKRTQGKQLMIWGIIALTVMIGVWSLVGIVGNTFNLDTGVLPQVKSPTKP